MRAVKPCNHIREPRKGLAIRASSLARMSKLQLLHSSLLSKQSDMPLHTSVYGTHLKDVVLVIRTGFHFNLANVYAANIV